jgi:hypothetical protein
VRESEEPEIRPLFIDLNGVVVKLIFPIMPYMSRLRQGLARVHWSRFGLPTYGNNLKINLFNIRSGDDRQDEAPFIDCLQCIREKLAFYRIGIVSWHIRGPIIHNHTRKCLEPETQDSVMNVQFTVFLSILSWASDSQGKES